VESFAAASDERDSDGRYRSESAETEHPMDRFCSRSLTQAGKLEGSLHHSPVPSLHTRHAEYTSDNRYTTRNKVNSIDDAESDEEASKLLQPSVEVRSSHEQHPPTQTSNAQSNSNAQTQLVGDRSITLVILSLDSSSLDSAIVHANATVLAQATVSEDVG